MHALLCWLFFDVCNDCKINSTPTINAKQSHNPGHTPNTTVDAMGVVVDVTLRVHPLHHACNFTFCLSLLICCSIHKVTHCNNTSGLWSNSSTGSRTAHTHTSHVTATSTIDAVTVAYRYTTFPMEPPVNGYSLASLSRLTSSANGAFAGSSCRHNMTRCSRDGAGKSTRNFTRRMKSGCKLQHVTHSVTHHT